MHAIVICISVLGQLSRKTSRLYVIKTLRKLHTASSSSLGSPRKVSSFLFRESQANDIDIHVILAPPMIVMLHEYGTKSLSNWLLDREFLESL